MAVHAYNLVTQGAEAEESARVTWKDPVSYRRFLILMNPVYYFDQ